MEIKEGMKFKDACGRKCHVVNVFLDEDEEIVVYRCWIKTRKRWVYSSDYKYLFLIGFEYGCKWE